MWFIKVFGFFAFWWPQNAIPEGCWDLLLKVTWLPMGSYLEFWWPENAIPSGLWDPLLKGTWRLVRDHRLKVLWLLVKDFLALWQPEIDIPVGLENHRRHGTWLLEKHFLAFWLPENAIPYGLKDARRLLATWERMLRNEFWRQEISIHHADELGIWQSLSHCLEFLTCKYMISQGSWHSTEGYVASHERIWEY